jgi:hypothetical protein
MNFPTTPIIICADDYALTPGISSGIRDLARAGRLCATSAMTVSPYWGEQGNLLKSFEPALTGQLAIGLHFTLTDLKPLTDMPNFAPGGRFPGLGPLLKQAMLRKVNGAEIARELTAQIDRFEEVMGRPPAYLDGHHHIHQLPVVRDVVIEITKNRLGPKPFVRLCDESLFGIVARGVSIPRAAIISLLGRVFASHARDAGLRGNTGFRGVRDFRADENVAHLFQAYLEKPQAGIMIMCHPGHDEPVADIEDEIHERRPGEFAFLNSDAFASLLSDRKIELRPPTAF